jgi:hypothetical protein
MFHVLADFLLGAGLARRESHRAPMRSPSRARHQSARHDALGWQARIGTW